MAALSPISREHPFSIHPDPQLATSLSTTSRPKTKSESEILRDRISNCFQITSSIENLILFHQDTTEVLFRRMAADSLTYLTLMERDVCPILKEIDVLETELDNTSCLRCDVSAALQVKIEAAERRRDLAQKKLYPQAKKNYSQGVILQLRACSTYRITSDVLVNISDPMFPKKLMIFEDNLKQIFKSLALLDTLDQTIEKLESIVKSDPDDEYRVEDHSQIVKNQHEIRVAERKRLRVFSELQPLFLWEEIFYFLGQLCILDVEKIKKIASKEIILNDLNLAKTTLQIINKVKDIKTQYPMVGEETLKSLDHFCLSFTNAALSCIEIPEIRYMIITHVNFQIKNQLPSNPRNYSRLYCFYDDMIKNISNLSLSLFNREVVPSNDAVSDNKEIFLSKIKSVQDLIFERKKIQEGVVQTSRRVLKDKSFEGGVKFFSFITTDRSATYQRAFVVVDEINRSYKRLLVDDERSSLVLTNSDGTTKEYRGECIFPDAFLDLVAFIIQTNHYDMIKPLFNDLEIPDSLKDLIIQYGLDNIVFFRPGF